MKALVICTGGGIGDVLLATPVMRALHERYESVVALTAPAHRDVLAGKLKAKNLDNVKLLPLQSKDRLPEVLASADAGVVMETRRMADLSMPSKILNQMACGRPLIAVTSPQTALGLLIAENNGAREAG